MKVADIMEPAARTVAVDTPVCEVVVSLADAQVTGLPVLGARNRVVGVVSSTDLIIAQAAMAGRMSRSGRAIGRSRDGRLFRPGRTILTEEV
jgi:CBS-domain-containing membrane protein